MKNYIYGMHAVLSALEHNPSDIKQLFLLSNREDKKVQNIIHVADKEHITYEFLPRKDLEKLVGEVAHQGIIAEINMGKTYHESDLENLIMESSKPAFFLILDGIQDPHNLGACLRSADAAGVTGIIAPKDRAASLTPTAIKIACGAAETVPFIQVTNLVRTLKFLQTKNIWLYGFAEEAKTCIYDANLTGSIGLVLGAEGTGLRRLTREICDFLLYIPMAGFISSLNVSVATGIALFEVVRQRRNNEK